MFPESLGIETQIINGTINQVVQTDDFWVSLALVLGTLAVAGITLWGVWTTNKRTRESNEQLKKSNELLEMELRSKFRPVFFFKNFKVARYASGKITIHTDLFYYGDVPIRKVITYSQRTNNEKLIHILKEKNDLRTSMPRGTIQSKAYIPFEEVISYANDEQQELRYFIWFEFSVFNKKEESVCLLRIDPSNLDNVKQDWFIQEDIDEARQEIEDINSGRRSAPT